MGKKGKKPKRGKKFVLAGKKTKAKRSPGGIKAIVR